MKLYTSALSPFARKCQILIRAKGLVVEEVVAAKDGANGYGSTLNPMGKIPLLVRETGEPLYDSPIICEYLDSLSRPWLAPGGETRWQALRLHRTGDGLAEAVYNYRYETVRDKNLHWPDIITRHETAILSIINSLNSDVKTLARHWDYSTISIVCALDYVDFRAGHLNWRDKAAELANWHKGFESDPIWQSTNAYT